MPKIKKKADLVPEEFQTIMEAADFWDSHDLADYWKDAKEVRVSIKVPPIPRYVPLDKEIAELIAEAAQRRHISMETLVNLWLRERTSGRLGSDQPK
jgi:hypothetical protein